MISVIVPVYNVQEYLHRCVDSLLAQSYGDFELLLIDDGSTDNSNSICDAYAERDERVCVYHKENGGLSDARNYGLDRMRGSYVTFIDSDDYVGPEYLATLLDIIRNSTVDVAIVSMEMVYTEDMVFFPTTDVRKTIDHHEALRYMLIDKEVSFSACAKLFKSEVFSENRFPIGKLYEDLFTIPYVITDCHACGLSTAKLYYYYHREGSIMNSVSEKHIQMWTEGVNRLLAFTKEREPALHAYAEAYLLKGLFWRVLDWNLCSERYVETAKRIKKEYHKYLKKALWLPNMTIREKIKALIFLFNVRLYHLFRIKWISMSSNPDSAHYIDGRTP